MNGAEIVAAERVEQTIHDDRRAVLHVEALRLPASQEHPPLAIERTTLPDGPTRRPVLLVHGFAQNRWTWRVSRRSLAARLAAEGYEVLNLELRGHGLSRSYGAGNARAFEEYVADAVRVVRGCDEPPFLVGHSLGGAVCIGAATEAAVAGVVHLAGIYAFATRNPTLRLLARASLRAQPALTAAPVRVSTGWAGKLIGRLYAFTDVAGYVAPLAGWVPGSVERDVLEERLAKGFDWTSAEVWLQMSRWALGERFAYDEAFRRTDVPLLVLAGSMDRLLHPDDARRCYSAAGCRDKTFIEFEPFEHGSHWGHLDLVLGRRAPDVVWPILVDWLNARA